MPGFLDKFNKQNTVTTSPVADTSKQVPAISILDKLNANAKVEGYDDDKRQEYGEQFKLTSTLKQGTTQLSGKQFKAITGTDFDTASDILGRSFNPLTEDIQKKLGEEQSVGAQIVGFANQLQAEVIGGAIEGFGYLGDLSHWADRITGGEGDWGNFVSDIGKSYKTWADDSTPIFETDPGTFNPGNSGWWFKNGVSVGSTLSLLIPAIAASRLAGYAGRGLKIFGALEKLGAAAGISAETTQAISTAVGRGVASRHMENMMEANGIYDETKQKYLNEVKPDGSSYTEEEINKLASDAASNVYKANWPLVIQDIMQMALIARGPNLTKAIDSAALAKAAGKSAGLARLTAGYTIGKDMIFEGMEEAYQFVVGEEAKHAIDVSTGLTPDSNFGDRLKEYAQDGQLWTAAAFGTLGAGVMQAVGPGISKLMGPKGQKTEDQIRIDEIKSRGALFASFNKIYKEASDTQNPSGIKMANKGIAYNMAMRAYQTGNLDLIIEQLDAMKNATAEEMQANGFEESLVSNIDNIKAEINSVVGIIKQSQKIYDSSVIDKAVYLTHINSYLNEDLNKAEQDETSATQKFPKIIKLSIQGRDMFNTVVSLNAYNIAKLQVTAMLNGNVTNFSKAKLLENIENYDKNIARLTTELANLKSQRILTSEDNKILAGTKSTFTVDIISAKISGLLTSDAINNNTAELAYLASKKGLAEIKAEKAATAKAAADKAAADAKLNAAANAQTAQSAASAAAALAASAAAALAAKGTPITTQQTDEELMRGIANHDLIGLSLAEITEIANDDKSPVSAFLAMQKKATEEFEKKKAKAIAKSTIVAIPTLPAASANNDDILPTAQNINIYDIFSEETKKEFGLEPPKITTGHAIAWKSSGNSESTHEKFNDVNIALSNFLENPNNDLSKYELRISIDTTKKGSEDLDSITNDTIGKLPVKLEFFLDGKPVNNPVPDPYSGEDKPYTVYVHDDDYSFAPAYSKVAIAEVIAIKTKALAAHKKGLTLSTNIIKREEGFLNSDISADSKFILHSVLESINIDPTKIEYVIGGNGGIYLTTGDRKEQHSELSHLLSAKVGAVYAVVTQANGSKFPLRLWVSSLSNEEASLIYDIYSEITSNPVAYNNKLSKSIMATIVASSNPIVKNLGSVIDLKAIKLKDLLSFLVFEGQITKGKKDVMQLFTSMDGSITLGSKVYSKEEFATTSGKATFIQDLISNKRRQIARNNNSPEYKTYLAVNEILITNAIRQNDNLFVQPTLIMGKVEEPTAKKTKPTTTTSTIDAKAEIERLQKEMRDEYDKLYNSP